LKLDYRHVPRFEDSRAADFHAIQYETGVGRSDFYACTNSSLKSSIQPPIKATATSLFDAYSNNMRYAYLAPANDSHTNPGDPLHTKPKDSLYPDAEPEILPLEAVLQVSLNNTKDAVILPQDLQTVFPGHHDRMVVNPEPHLPNVFNPLFTATTGSPKPVLLSHQNISPRKDSQPAMHLAAVPYQSTDLRLTRPVTSTQASTTITNSVLTTQKVTKDAPVTAGSQLLTHLPRLRQGEETHISLLPCDENDKWFRMVWNKSAQESYSVYDHQTPNLPSIIYRKQGTVGSHTSIAQGTLASQKSIAEGSNSGRKRWLDKEDGLEERGGKRQKTGL
jgi:hypothetical protein